MTPTDSPALRDALSRVVDALQHFDETSADEGTTDLPINQLDGLVAFGYMTKRRGGRHGNIYTLTDAGERIARATRPAERADSEGAAQRYVVQKQSGSRYAYVKDTQSGRILGRYDILKGVGKRNGWNLADAHADRLNNAGLRATQQPNDGGEGCGG